MYVLKFYIIIYYVNDILLKTMCNLHPLLQDMYIAIRVISSLGYHKSNSSYISPDKLGLHVKLTERLLNGRENNFQPVKNESSTPGGSDWLTMSFIIHLHMKFYK